MHKHILHRNSHYMIGRWTTVWVRKLASFSLPHFYSSVCIFPFLCFIVNARETWNTIRKLQLLNVTSLQSLCAWWMDNTDKKYTGTYTRMDATTIHMIIHCLAAFSATMRIKMATMISMKRSSPARDMMLYSFRCATREADKLFSHSSW